MLLPCRAEYFSNLHQAVLVWSTIAGWIVFSMTLYYVVLRERMEGAPGLGSQFFGVSGTIQVLVVLAGSVLFFPTCTSCYCPSYQPLLYLVPAIEGSAGIACLWTAWNLSSRASLVSNDIFTKIPMETEMTEVSEAEGEDEESSPF